MLRSSLFKQPLTVDLSSIGYCLQKLQSPIAKSKSVSRLPQSLRSRRALIECLEQRVVFNVDVATGVPALHGNLGAAASLYLDFNGHFEPVWGTYNNVTTPAYDIDGDATTFNARELSNIQSIWQGVAEDYAPFNIDVTTVQPAVLAPGTPIANANKVALRVAIGGSSGDWYVPGSNSGGGISSIGSFTNSIANVAYVFAANQDKPISTGKIVSHEAGHSFGLNHAAGTTAFWEPIMPAAGGVKDFSTWSSGLNDQGILQDDMAILAGTTNGFGYRADDRGNTNATATALTGTGNTWSGSGIVGTNTDVDMFSFTVAVGSTYRIAVNGDTVSPNLDVMFELRNSAGQLIGAADPLDTLDALDPKTSDNTFQNLPLTTLDAQIDRFLAPGDYYLAVKGSGLHYGWIGQYSINIDNSPIGLDNNESGYVYFSDAFSHKIKRSRLTGSQQETLVDLIALNGSAALSQAYDLAVDLAGDKMYWRVWSGSVGFIQRANLDGSAPVTVLSGVAGSRGFALDNTAGKLYWFNSSTKKIQRANLDGSVIEDVVTQPTMAVGGIALDTVNNKIYWTDPTQDNVQRANLDGTNSEILWTGVAPTSPYVIALDVGAGTMYWSDTDQDVIRRANLDGTNVVNLVDSTTTAGSLDAVKGLALDIPAGKLYWSNAVGQSALYRANLDGTAISSIEAAQYPMGLAIVHPGPGISVTHRTGLSTSELGVSDFFRVALNTQPTADVTIAVNSSDATEGTVSTSLLTFTPANWFVTQTVIVQGVDDTIGDGNIAYSIALAAAVSTDPNYSGVDPSDAFVVNLDKPTKFYVVNDATQDLTYEYSSNGGLVESYGLNSSNTSPRGAASTSAGTTVWVVDANRIVYVYNNSGLLLGSWSAGTMASNATPEGIATNGTDIWIVDSKSDKVYKYAGAATRLSGSQTATSSFNLSSSNSNPKDIVTDGTYLWVVNDSSTDKVFKYTVAGSLQGSWTIATPGASSPTGITIDPANVSNIWIVDNASKLVYQYTAAATLTSGSLAASTTFALAAGNTNPQGIADPPPAVLGAPGKTSDVKSPFAGAVPMPWFSGSTANNGSVSLQQVQSKVRTTDDFMSVLGLAFEQPNATVSVGRSTDVTSTKSIDRRAGIDAEIKDHDMDELIGLVAHDLWGASGTPTNSLPESAVAAIRR